MTNTDNEIITIDLTREELTSSLEVSGASSMPMLTMQAPT